jgi:hypothetical protein
MEPTKKIVQTLKKPVTDSFSLAEKYYDIISSVNGLGLTDREIQLVAFASIRGNISYANIREEFCKKYNTTNQTINNIISKLKKVGVMVKDGSKVKVNPIIVLDFNKDVTLEIKLIHGKASEPVGEGVDN